MTVTGKLKYINGQFKLNNEQGNFLISLQEKERLRLTNDANGLWASAEIENAQVKDNSLIVTI